MMWKVFLASIAIAAAVAGCDHGHDHGHDHGATSAAPTPPVPSGTNPVQHEMRLLHETMRDTVTAIANGDVKGIPAQLHKIHGAKDATSAALKAGTYKPPKNGDKTDRFVELDETFHKELVGIVRAAQKNDVPATAEALGKALAQCNGCHSEFRN